MLPFLSLQQITKSFGSVRALQGASLEIQEGKITAVVGDNGSGKSTLIHILTGNLKPDAGQISIRGKAYSHLTIQQSLDAGIRAVYQDLSLDNYKNSAENVFLGREIMRGPFLNRKKMLQQTRLLLEQLHIQIPDLAVPVRNLSGGQRQGLAIARALLTPGNLLVLDEPTAAMGIQEAHSAVQILKHLREQGMTLLIVSHNLYQVFDLADRIFVMRAGSCIADVLTCESSPEKIQQLILQKEQAEE